MRFSDQIRRAIDEAGMTRRRVCKEIGLDEGYMSRFMKGKVGLSMAMLDKLFEFLGLYVAHRRDGSARPAKGRHKREG